MWRHAIASVLIGLLVSLLVLAFAAAGLSAWAGAHLHRWYSLFEQTDIPGSPALLPALQIPSALLAALGVAWVTVRLPSRGRSAVFALATAALAALASPVLALYDLLFDPSGAIAAALLAWLAAALYERSEEGRRRRLFRSLVDGRVSPETAEALAAAPFAVKLGGDVRTVATLAVRVLDHARLRENLGAGRSVDLCNELLGAAAEFLIGRDAYLDEHAPDGLRVHFGVPLPDPEPARAAAKAALALRGHLDQAGGELAERYEERITWGVGLACGETTAGLFGHGRFTRFGTLGHEAELAWRLAGANAGYGSTILASAATFASLGEAAEFRPIDLIHDGVGGRPEEIYELLAEGGEFGEMSRLRRDAFWRGVVRMRAGDYEAAQQEFRDARVPGIEDRPLEHFLASVSERLASPHSTA